MGGAKEKAVAVDDGDERDRWSSSTARLTQVAQGLTFAYFGPTLGTSRPGRDLQES